MIFRFSLSHSVLGSLVISEPDGWIATKLKLERHEEYHSLIEYFEGDFVFYGDNGSENGGIDFIRQVENTYGPDAELAITIEIAPDNISYQTIFIGQLDLWNIEEMPDNKAQIPIIRNDFWAKFINRYDTPVDIQASESVDVEPVDVFDSINLRLTSQTILKRYYGEWSNGETVLIDAADGYLQLTPNNITLDEIETAFNLGFAWNPEIPVWWMEADEAGVYTFNFQLCLSNSRVFAAGMAPADPRDQFGVLFNISDNFWNFYFRLNSDTAQIFTQTNVLFVGTALSSGYAKFTFSTVLELKVGDIITVYGEEVVNIATKLAIWGTEGSIFKNTGDTEDTAIDNVTSEEIPSFFDVRADTVFPSNNAESFLLHDVAGQVIDRITSVDQAFYSELLGSDQTIYRQYPADGCQWKYALAKGLQIRRYSLIEKPFFQSFKQWWEGANPIFNLGLSYETVAGDEVIRVEEKRHFYDDSEVSVNLDFVRDIVRKYDESRIFKTVKIGYKKWQSEDISGIDDPQTKKTYATILKKAGRELSLESDFIAASLAIETTRRKTREKSADYKFDNDTFIIAINPIPVDVSPETSPDVTDYEPELDENFDNITNLLNSETRYNLRLTPARNFLRWLDWASAGLQAYLSSAFKFSSGEGNYDMTSDMINDSDGCVENRLELSEKQDIEVSADPFHLALLYEITCPLEWGDYVLIRDNRKKAIGISQTNDNHVKFFIKDLEYEVVEGRVTIQAWSKEFMEIEVIDSETQMQVCAPALPCEDAYLTELGDEYITESGDCLILN